ncbi:MAG: DUF4214 domain-containing protein [Acidimicrobiales bacterium]
MYQAYFQRAPDQDGWIYWIATFGSKTNTNLDVVSDSFALSKEFQLRYGTLTDTDFVSLVYRNVLGRDPDAGGLAHWVDSLGAGYPRGSVMVAFSESAEYVNRTGTSTPLAGFLLWYDRGFRYGCGLSIPNGVQAVTVPTDIPTPYADIFVLNAGTSLAQIDLKLRFLVNGVPVDVTTGDPDLLPAGHYLYGSNLELPAGLQQIILTEAQTSTVPDVMWAVVFYDHPHAEGRPGWILD